MPIKTDGRDVGSMNPLPVSFVGAIMNELGLGAPAAGAAPAPAAAPPAAAPAPTDHRIPPGPTGPAMGGAPTYQGKTSAGAPVTVDTGSVRAIDPATGQPIPNAPPAPGVSIQAPPTGTGMGIHHQPQSMLDMPRGGAGMAANQYAHNAGGRMGSGGNTMSVGAIHITQTAAAETGSDMLTRIRGAVRSLNMDVGLA